MTRMDSCSGPACPFRRASLLQDEDISEKKKERYQKLRERSFSAFHS